MGDKKKIDELFSKGLADFEASPEQDVWARVSSSMDEKKRKRRLLLLRWTTTASALLLAFFTGYYFNDWNKVSSPETQGTTVPSEVISNRESQNEKPQQISKHTTEPEDNNTIDQMSTTKAQTQAIAANSKALNKEDTENEETVIESNVLHKTSMLTLNYRSTPSIPEAPATLVALAPISDESAISPALAQAETDELQTTDDITYYEDHAKKQTISRLSISAMASPTIPFSEVNVKENSTATNMNIQQEEPQSSYAAGINVGYRTSKRWEIQTGLMVNNWSQNASDILLNVTPSSITSSNTQVNLSGNTSLGTVDFNGNYDPASQEKVEISSFQDASGNYVVLPGLTEHYQFIDIPLSAAYYLIASKKWSIKVSGGINSRFLNSSDVTLTYANGDEQAYENITPAKYSMQLLAGAGLGYSLSKSLKFGLQPTLLYGITSVNQHNQVDTYFHQMLIYSALTYSF